MIKFTWDERKNTINVKKHGFGFELASSAFEDPFALFGENQQHEGEMRCVTLGMTGGVILTITHLPLEEDKSDPGTMVCRLISAREATRQEKKHYDKARAEDSWYGPKL